MQETKGDLWPDKKIIRKSSFPSFQVKRMLALEEQEPKRDLHLKLQKVTESHS